MQTFVPSLPSGYLRKEACPTKWPPLSARRLQEWAGRGPEKPCQATEAPEKSRKQPRSPQKATWGGKTEPGGPNFPDTQDKEKSICCPQAVETIHQSPFVCGLWGFWEVADWEVVNGVHGSWKNQGVLTNVERLKFEGLLCLVEFGRLQDGDSHPWESYPSQDSCFFQAPHSFTYMLSSSWATSSKAQTRALPCPLQHLLLGSRHCVQWVSLSQEAARQREVPPLNRVLPGLPQAPPQSGAGTQRGWGKGSLVPTAMFSPPAVCLWAGQAPVQGPQFLPLYHEPIWTQDAKLLGSTKSQ